MNTHPLSYLLVAAAFLAPSAFGQVIQPPARPGVRIELTTSGLTFEQPWAPATPGGPIFQPSPSSTTGRSRRHADSFTATASVTNRSNASLAFTFPSAATADARITFALTDSSGKELWRSTETAAGEEPLEKVLKSKATWKRTVRVPLILDGTPLVAGHYRLTATAGTDAFAKVSTSFQVLGTPSNPPAAIPLSGYVLDSDFVIVLDPNFPSEDLGYAVHTPKAGALVEVFDTLIGNLPPVWSGLTDASGRFECPSPPQRAIIRASQVGDNGPLPGKYLKPTLKVADNKNGVNSYPLLQIPGSPLDQVRLTESVKEVRVLPVEGRPDQILVEADLIGRHGGLELSLKEITFSGVLIFEATEYIPRTVETYPPSPMTLRARLPKMPGAYKVRVITKTNTRESTIGPAEE